MQSLQSAAVRTKNNFDLIRLFAALQVAVSHATDWMHVPAAWLRPLSYFPGVPIFFFISGYLIYQSFANIKRDNRLTVFFTNRILRLYPALIICVVFAVILTYYSGYFAVTDVSRAQFIAWLATQVTFLQFFNPDFFRDYATGKLNASLWTISVELQFYVLTPIVFILFNKYKKTALALFVLCVLFNIGNSTFNPRATTAEKLFNVSFLPWIAMFGFGAYLSTNQFLQQKILKCNILVPLILYIAVYYCAERWNLGTGNSINIVSFVLLAWLVFKAAWTMPALSEKLLHKNDFSYGIYIYHMPIVNFMIYKGMDGSDAYLLTALLCTIGLAMLSWFVVEKPALHLKKVTLRRIA